jgi:hypothetical protein
MTPSTPAEIMAAINPERNPAAHRFPCDDNQMKHR